MSWMPDIANISLTILIPSIMAIGAIFLAIQSVMGLVTEAQTRRVVNKRLQFKERFETTSEAMIELRKSRGLDVFYRASRAHHGASASCRGNRRETRRRRLRPGRRPQDLRLGHRLLAPLRSHMAAPGARHIRHRVHSRAEEVEPLVNCLFKNDVTIKLGARATFAVLPHSLRNILIFYGRGGRVENLNALRMKDERRVHHPSNLREHELLQRSAPRARAPTRYARVRERAAL